MILLEELALATVQDIEKEVDIYNITETKEGIMPMLSDPHLKAEVVFKGIEFPTNMAFLGQDDIVVLEKNEGTVKRIVNGQVLNEPLLKTNVTSNSERGMLGIAYFGKVNSQLKNSTNNDNLDSRVFLYLTEEENKEVFNRIYRYDLLENKLINPKLLLELPGTPGARHNGGEIIVGPDGNIYTIIGSVNAILNKAANKEDKEPDGRSGILRVTQDGEVVESIIGDENPTSNYYGYGIRNGFGMDFDPVTGNLWDTENGEQFNDEINLVEPGFNSGWSQIQGLGKSKDSFDQNDDLVNFDGKGVYSDPIFVWNNSVGVTAIKFLNSDKYGQEYKNDMFVGDFNNGNLYHFELNKDRTELILEGDLQDKIANDDKELYNVTLGTGFGGITDMQVGPDGYLYLLSLHEGSQTCNPNVPISQCVEYNSGVKGTIFRIVPVN